MAFLIEAVRRVGSDTVSDASAHLEALRVVVDSTDTRVSVRTEQPQAADGREYTVDYQITLPADVRILASLVNGLLAADSLAAGGALSCVNGDITVGGRLGGGGPGRDQRHDHGGLVQRVGARRQPGRRQRAARPFGSPDPLRLVLRRS